MQHMHVAIATTVPTVVTSMCRGGGGEAAAGGGYGRGEREERGGSYGCQNRSGSRLR